jgi:hypothetical protein
MEPTSDDRLRLEQYRGAIGDMMQKVRTQHPHISVLQLMSYVLASVLAAQHDRIVELEVRLRGVEALSGFRDCGVWREGAAYERNDAASFRGSLWIAQRGVDLGKPGQPASGWRMAVKNGQYRERG